MPGPSNGLEIISTAVDGTQGNADSGGSGGSGSYTGSDSFSISPDGTKIAFTSDASNLVPRDDNGYTDVFVKDLTTGAITLISTPTVPAQASSLQPVFSPDGTSIAYTAFDTGGGRDVYVKNLATGATTLVDTDSKGNRTRIASSPVFSPDGTKIAFSLGSGLTPGGDFTVAGLYLEDLSTGKATLVSDSAAGVPGDVISSEPTFSPDGTKIVFTSASSNLGPTGTNHHTEIYIKDLITGAVSLVSTSATGQLGRPVLNGNEDNSNATFSPDGTKVAFQSYTNDLVPGDDDNRSDIFVKDLKTGDITRITTLADGTSEGGFGPAFSPDGTKIAFWTSANGYGGVYSTGTSIYVKDLATGAFTLISAPADGKTVGSGASYDPQFSRDGSKIVFWSTNDTLVAHDANGTTADIFVKTLLSAPVDVAPVAVADSYTIAKGTPLLVEAAAGLLANDTDADGDFLTAVLKSGVAHGSLDLRTDGTFEYTPNAGFTGLDSFTYMASDGKLTSRVANVTIAVGAPVTAADDTYYTSAGGSLTVVASNGVLANDSAPDGGLKLLGLVVDGVLKPIITGEELPSVATPSGGVFTLDPDGGFSYGRQHVGDTFVGTETFTYRATDADGSTADATITIKSGIGTGAPVTAADDTYYTSAGGSLTVVASNGVLANDSAPDGGLKLLGLVVDGVLKPIITGEELPSVATPSGGVFTLDPDGGFSYGRQHVGDTFVGTETFTYRATDADGSTADATITIKSGIGTGAPVTAADDTYYTSAGGSLTVVASNGVLANDSAPDGGLKLLGLVVDGVLKPIITGEELPSVATPSGGVFTLDPDGGFSYGRQHVGDTFVGTETFTYRATDADGSTADATITIKSGIGTGQPVTEDLSEDTGASSNDKITANAFLHGAGAANAVVSLIVDGIASPQSVTADASGNWTFKLVLADGMHTVVASETDAAGQTSTATLTFILDKTPPAVAINTTPSVTGGQVILTGTVADSNAIAAVELFNGTTDLGAATLNGDGTWTFAKTLAAGSYNALAAVATDVAGNHATATAPFALTYLNAGTISTITSSYDANGNLIKEVTSIYDPTGLVTRQITSAGGISEVRDFVIIGKPYATQDAFYDNSTHKVISMTRAYADGSQAFAEVTNTDGSQTATFWSPDGVKQVSSFDKNGAVTEDERFNAAGQTLATTTFNADGSRVSSTFDPATGVLQSLTTRNADKSTTIDSAVAGKPYAEQIASIDAAGKLTSTVRKYSDGATAFSQTLNPDGSSEVLNFDTSGRETTSIEFHSDGSHDVFLRTYVGTGTTPASIQQDHYGTGNQKLSSDIAAIDGSHKQTAFAANVTLTSNTEVKDAFTSSAAGSDTFVFRPAFGQDLITHFHAGMTAGSDTIQLDSSIAPDFAHLQSMMSASGRDTLIIASPTDSILLTGVALPTLVAQNFQFVSHNEHV